MSSDYISIYVTFSDVEEAEKVCLMLVDEKLIACANILPQVKSIYRWEGKLENHGEAAALMKTRKEKFTAVKDMVLRLHSYDCPCLVSYDIQDGHSEYLDWLGQSLA